MDSNTSTTKHRKISAKEMDRILSDYSVFRKLIDMHMYNKNYFGNAEIFLKKEQLAQLGNLPGDLSDVASKMFGLRRFILSLGGTNERLFLFYHYIHCEKVSRVAELIGISRRSAFRLKIRALEYAAARYPIFLEKQKEEVK